MKKKEFSGPASQQLAHNQYTVPSVMKFLQTDGFWVCLHGGDVMTRHIFKQVLTSFNRFNIMAEPWLEWVAAGRPYVWQHEPDPCHISR